MKKLKLFEDFNKKEFSILVDQAFSSIIDEEKYPRDQIVMSDEGDSIYIGINTDDPNHKKESDEFSDYFKSVEFKYNILKDVNHCLEMINKMSDTDLNFDFFEAANHLEIYISQVKKSGEFWSEIEKEYGDNKIKIDYTKLKKLLNFKNEIGMSSDGRNHYLDFTFKNDEIDSDKSDNLIKNVLNLKINELPLTMPFKGSSLSKEEPYYKNKNRGYTSYRNGHEIRGERSYISFKLNDKINIDW